MPIFLVFKVKELSCPPPPNGWWLTIAGLLLIISGLCNMWQLRTILKEKGKTLDVLKQLMAMSSENIELSHVHSSCPYQNWVASSCNLYYKSKAEQKEVDSKQTQN